jgi:hypothetical protein
MKISIKIENYTATTESTLEITDGSTDREDAETWLNHLLDACMILNENEK